MPVPDAIIESTNRAVQQATKRYLQDRDPAAYEFAMRRELAKAHTAAYLRGDAERSAAGKIKAWLSKLVGKVPKETRAAITARLDHQFGYLSDFIGGAADKSDAQVAAQAALYPGAVRATYYQALSENALPVYPGGCPQCYGRCRCSVERRGRKWYWNATMDAQTCEGCRARGNEWQPYEG